MSTRDGAIDQKLFYNLSTTENSYANETSVINKILCSTNQTTVDIQA